MFKSILAAAALLTIPVAASAVQVVLTPASVIGDSGAYGPQFAAGNIFSQQAGTIVETFGNGYWINPDNGPANAYITVDLGSVVSLKGLKLYNTHNGFYGDRGTGNFSIYGSNSVTAGQLDTPTLILSGTLAPASVVGPLAGQAFAASGSYRYISFNPTSVSTAPDGLFGPGVSCCGANVYGLDELRVYSGPVPEPESWVLLIAGFGLVGAAARRRAVVAA